MGLAVLSFGVGDVLFDFVYRGDPPTPSLADPFYLAFYPGCYVALLLLVRARVSTFNRSVWLDGLIAALTTAAIGAAVVFGVVLAHTHGREFVVLVNLSYPLADVVLIALTVFVFAITSWRPGREWATLGAALIAITVADSLYLDLSATASYSEGTLLDALWPTALVMLAVAGWQRRDQEHVVELEGRFLGAIPIGCGSVALAVLVENQALWHLNPVAIGLATATIATVLVRTALSFGENTRLLRKTKEQSLTDALTQIGNRRKLTIDLERELGREKPRPLLLAILDLNGFKNYNDRFGHPGGDALLARLAANLDTAFAARGQTYRLGGDEFCVFASLVESDAETLIDAALKALFEEGEGFAVTASCGAVVLPDEAADMSNALRIADERLYAHKAEVYRTRGDSYEVLTRALSEREETLREHLRDVAELSLNLASRLGLTESERTELGLAAELHDVGKLAIPDTVLQKPGPLNKEEWVFMRRHTTIGQRILAGAPALQGIGEIVRATHERWDGTGYPDGLVGKAIPYSARIIALGDAYTAMTTDRPYRAAITPSDALAELRRCAGTQFDPELVSEFCEMMLEQARHPAAEAVSSRNEG